jgi:hydroxyethylthiazole kinase-like uncharacterized protein yjeF
MIEAVIDPEYLRSHPLPKHQAGDKHSRGRVLVVAGNLEMPGAAYLAGLGALRAGAGVLRIATCRTNAPHLGAIMPEAMVIGFQENSAGEIAIEAGHRLLELANNSDAVLIGPGMVDEGSVAKLSSRLLEEADGPQFVLDAAAFTALRHINLPRQQKGRVVGTPHAGEMAKFLQVDRRTVEKDPAGAAREASRKYDLVIAMKGERTHVVAPDGRALLNAGGTIGLATSGSGDTLAGILIGLLARGADPHVATAWAVYLHAEAGRRLAERMGRFGLLAREIPEEVPFIMRPYDTAE